MSDVDKVPAIVVLGRDRAGLLEIWRHQGPKTLWLLFPF